MAKIKTYEEAQEALTSAKKARQDAGAALKTFRKSNKIKQGTDASTIEDKKVSKEYTSLTDAYSAAGTALDAAKEAVKELKPKKAASYKYEYPAEVVTADDRKRYRAKIRREKASAEKAAKGETKKASKKDKKESTEPAGEKPTKSSKKSKKVAKKED